MRPLSSRSERLFRHVAGGVPALIAAVVVTACAGEQRVVVPEGARRRPDGVAIDPPTVYPLPSPAAQAADAVVVLEETPLGADVARGLVLKFWSATIAEDRVSFQSLLIGHATSYNPGTGVVEEAMPFWNRRFDALEYQLLGQAPPPREDSIEIARADQWDRGGLTDDTRPSDVVAVLHVPRVTTGRPLTGDTITFQLRRSRDHYQIVRLTEEFAFP